MAFLHHATPAEVKVIRQLRSEANQLGRVGWVPHEYGRSRDTASYLSVSTKLQTDFVEKVRELSSQFPGETIEVLFEGAGFSTFPQELERRCKGAGLRVRVSKSDLYSKKNYARMASDAKTDGQNYRSAAPEQLVKIFGERHFHLVISRSGGLTYTPFPQVKGIANVCGVLKPGGEAHIFSEDVDMAPMPFGRKIWLSQHGKPTEVGAFFNGNSEFVAKQEIRLAGAPFVEQFPILRIKRKTQTRVVAH